MSADTNNRLFDDFERLERERIGAGKHEEFHKMLDTWNRLYLG